MKENTYCIVKIKKMQGNHPVHEDYFTGSIEDAIAYLSAKYVGKDFVKKVSNPFLEIFKGMGEEFEKEIERRKKEQREAWEKNGR